MPGAQQGPSFIPKRTPTKHKRVRGPRRMYVFSIIAYILIFGAVLTAAGVFIYKLQVEAQMVERQKTLAEAVDNFSQSDLEMVKEFEQRLHFANQRMRHHYAETRLLNFFERVTAEPVQIDQLAVVRVDDELFEVNGTVVTNTFNSTIFQREVMADESLVNAVFTESAKLTNLEGDDSDRSAPTVSPSNTDEAETVEFNLLMQLDAEAFHYEGVTVPSFESDEAASEEQSDAEVEDGGITNGNENGV